MEQSKGKKWIATLLNVNPQSEAASAVKVNPQAASVEPGIGLHVRPLPLPPIFCEF